MNTLPRWVRVKTALMILRGYGLDTPAIVAKLETDSGLDAVERAIMAAFSDTEPDDESP